MSAAVPAAVALLAYLVGARRARRWPVLRVASFALGGVALAVALSGPLDGAAAQRPAAHMVQHLLIGTLAPALVAAAAPVRLALAALPGSGRRALGRALRGRLAHALGRAEVAVPLAVVVFVLAHLPVVVDAALRSGLMHAGEHALLFYTGLLLWVVVLAVDPVPAPPSPLARLVWLTVVMIAMSAVGALYSSAPHVLVTGYASVPDALGAQQAAGAVMWVGGGVLLVPAMVATVFLAMVREEALQQRREALRR